MSTEKNMAAGKCITGMLWFFSIFMFINAFNFQHNPPGGWEKQMLPDLGGRTVSDMLFTDSLSGYAIAGNLVVRTTTGGNNWFVSDSLFASLTEIEFINKNTGFICGGNLYKTTNTGGSWKLIVLPPFGIAENDMDVISEDTIWITNRTGLDGGIFLTTNGGASWTRKYYGGGFSNPEKIYFANSRLGFASRATNNYLRTSDGGESWQIISGPTIWFNDIEFIDSLTGYKANGYMMKTTDAGLTWNQLPIPPMGDTISSNSVERISDLHNGTMYGVGPYAFYFSINRRGVIFKTTDSGQTWGYQLPDTAEFRFYKYDYTDFLNKDVGWAYQKVIGGIFTRAGGDTTIYVNVKNIGNSVPLAYKLLQNFPNPFNPKTIIRFEVESKALINISVYDISGRSVTVLLNGKLQPGTYETDFDGSSLPSGIYFCVMQSDSYRETITMALIK